MHCYWFTRMNLTCSIFFISFSDNLPFGDKLFVLFLSRKSNLRPTRVVAKRILGTYWFLRCDAADLVEFGAPGPLSLSWVDAHGHLFVGQVQEAYAREVRIQLAMLPDGSRWWVVLVSFSWQFVTYFACLCHRVGKCSGNYSILSSIRNTQKMFCFVPMFGSPRTLNYSKHA
jgi:hypothetical protein